MCYFLSLVDSYGRLMLVAGMDLGGGAMGCAPPQFPKRYSDSQNGASAPPQFQSPRSIPVLDQEYAFLIFSLSVFVVAVSEHYVKVST